MKLHRQRKDPTAFHLSFHKALKHSICPSRSHPTQIHLNWHNKLLHHIRAPHTHTRSVVNILKWVLNTKKNASCDRISGPSVACRRPIWRWSMTSAKTRRRSNPRALGTHVTRLTRVWHAPRFVLCIHGECVFSHQPRTRASQCDQLHTSFARGDC